MNTSVIEYKSLDETLHVYTHKTGLKAFVIPKKGYSKKYATFATNYGSINNTFTIPGQKEPIRVPDGIAHFLEHKLFEQKDGSVMDKFAKLGSSPNAYTAFTQTVYLFSCTDKFDENFNLLLNYVQNPYITAESVEKEKGIIGQEIRMYEDNPGWRSFFNLLRGLYRQHPVSIDIAGTVESISKIDREVLYQCYNTFYHPSNMVILVVGDVEPGEVFEMVEKAIQAQDARPAIERIFPQEPAQVHQERIEQKLAVSMPMFQMGFKDSRVGEKGIECLKHEVAVKLLLEMLAGRSSTLYNQLYEEGLVNSSFDTDFTLEPYYGFSTIGGESPDPMQVQQRFAEEVRKLQAGSLDKETYLRIKKAMKGGYMRQFNSVERISHMFMNAYFKGATIFDYLEVYDKISLEYVNEIFHSHFNLDRMALSVIKPV